MSKFMTSDKVEIFYNMKGEGDPIILIHGWSADSTTFDIQFEELSKNFKVIACDLRGHGRSERTDKGLTLDVLGRDLHELIEHLKLDKVLVVGWSMGASTIFSYVEQYGVEKLSGVMSFDMTAKLINDEDWKLGLWHGQYKLEDALNDMTTIANDFSDYAETFFKRVAPYMDDDMISMAMEDVVKNTPYVMNAFWLAMAVKDYRSVLGKITVPTLVAYGEKSTLYSADTAKYLNKEIPNSKVEVFENCTHLLIMENPEKATKVIYDFASEIFKSK